MALFPFALVLVLTVAVGGSLAVARRTPPSRESTVAAARRHARSTAAVALIAAPAAALGCAVVFVSMIPSPGSIGRALLLAPVAAGVAHTAVVLLGELTWPRPQGDVRRAGLARRGLLDAAPRWLLRVAATTAAVLGVVLVAGAVLADGSGRRVTVSLPEWSTTASPFPGLFYGGPAAVGVAVLALVTLAALRVVAERPAVVTDDPRIEAALRRASVHRVLRGATAAALALTAGMVFAAGSALHSVGSTGFASTAVYGAVGTALTVVACAGGLLAVVVACVPAPRVPADDVVPTA